MFWYDLASENCSKLTKTWIEKNVPFVAKNIFLKKLFESTKKIKKSSQSCLIDYNILKLQEMFEFECEDHAFLTH
ncbi:hypothetical protein BpHYR1_033913 [Brachionus plicatilis]|uniref:Uncharacterized protein n=1 Tax=Brachionus plicatilis TaxID=10195 RepID=A0A3M7QVB6_BRAPC|nr:hypothetical protein BpHYR1_033913 [Brachionus plicatilis]